MEKIKRLFQELGLSDKESIVYYTLLSCGNASAYTIAEKSGLKAPTVYLTLQNLIKKNIVYISPRSKKRLFYPKNPRDFLAAYEEKVTRTKSALPEILALLPSDIPKIKVQFYQGKKGIEESLYYGMRRGYKTKEVVGFYATAENLNNDYLDLTVKYLKDSQKHNTKIRGITPDHDSTSSILKTNSELGHDVRTIPYNEYSSKASIEAEGDFVRIIMLHEEKSIIIDNKILADMVRQIFEMVWVRNVDTPRPQK